MNAGKDNRPTCIVCGSTNLDVNMRDNVGPIFQCRDCGRIKAQFTPREHTPQGDADKDKATAYLRDSTPRPWRVRARDFRGWFRICDDRDYTIAEVSAGREIHEQTANASLILSAVNSWDAHRQLVAAAQKAANTFADFERTMGMLGRKPVAEAAHIAGEALRAALAALDAVEKP